MFADQDGYQELTDRGDFFFFFQIMKIMIHNRFIRGYNPYLDDNDDETDQILEMLMQSILWNQNMGKE